MTDVQAVIKAETFGPRGTDSSYAGHQGQFSTHNKNLENLVEMVHEEDEDKLEMQRATFGRPSNKFEESGGFRLASKESGEEGDNFSVLSKSRVLHSFQQTDQTNDLYKGQFYVNEAKQIVRHGKGAIQYANGSIYEGLWVDGIRQGYGRLIHTTGDMYEGDWLNDRANGYGTFTNLEGYKYVGYWRDDCQEGHGVETW